MSELLVTILMPCLNEAETLAFCVRQAVATLALLRANSRGRATMIAAGDTLADRALAAARAQGASVTV